MGFIERRPGEQGYRARYNDPLGRKHSRTFARKADAQRFLVEMEGDKARGSWIDPRGADMPLAAWAEEFLLLARRLSPTTVQTYRRDLTRYVLPRFGDYRIGRIPADEVENWLNDEVEAGIAPSSVHRHYRTLRRLLQVAVEKQHLEHFAESGLDGLVFPNGAGKPVSSSSFWNQHFTPSLRRAGVKCRVHDLRHTSVALAIAESAHPKSIQARMGHSSINVTLDRYGHLFPELDEAIASAFDGRLAAVHGARSSVVVNASFGSE